MNNRRADVRLSQTRKVMQGKKGNGREIKKDVRVQTIKRMMHHLRSSRHQIEDKDINLSCRIRVQAGSL